jgi:hypothetical protein
VEETLVVRFTAHGVARLSSMSRQSGSTTHGGYLEGGDAYVGGGRFNFDE